MASASSRLGKQLAEVIATLNSVGARFALIAGLALAPYKVIRATQDVHLLISAEGLIAFKLQGFVNNPRRTQDLEDIRSLIRANRNTLNMQQVREYFRLFSREPLLEEILSELE
jgi:hypothetical protein